MADSKNVGMVGIFLNEDAILKISNAPPLQGRTALERLYIWEYGACPRIDHRLGCFFFTIRRRFSLLIPVFDAAFKIVSTSPVNNFSTLSKLTYLYLSSGVG